MQRVNYDQLAPTYDQRFGGALAARGQALRDLAGVVKAGRILEAGCGTGHWLAALAADRRRLYGLDFSAGMLRQARGKHGPLLSLARGTALRLPYRAASFQLVYCVDAVHHFGDPAAFVAEAWRVLEPGGALAIITGNPHRGAEMWYAYQYFDGLYATDQKRFPTLATLAGWLTAQGFEAVSAQQVESIENTWAGRAVLDDPFLQKHASSQLALLSDDAYQAGLARLRAEIAAAEARGQALEFRSEWTLHAVTGRKAGRSA